LVEYGSVIISSGWLNKNGEDRSDAWSVTDDQCS